MKNYILQKKPNNFPIHCILLGLFLMVVGFIWYSMTVVKDYLEIFHQYSTEPRAPHDIILMSLRSFGLIFIIFGIGLAIFYYREGIRIKSIDRIYKIIIILGFLAALIGELIYTIMYYLAWSTYIDDQIDFRGFQERYFYANLFYLIYLIGLIVMFVIVCLLIFDLVKLKKIETVTPITINENKGPLDNFR
jgi:drug/metabolite transporter (DMT)-like permease